MLIWHSLQDIQVIFFQAIFLSYLINWKPLKYGSAETGIEYPMYAHVIGLIMSLASMLWIPGYAIYYILNQRGSLKDVRFSFFYSYKTYTVMPIEC